MCLFLLNLNSQYFTKKCFFSSHMSHVTCHLSPTHTATATDPPANSSTVHSDCRLVPQYRYFLSWGTSLFTFLCTYLGHILRISGAYLTYFGPYLGIFWTYIWHILVIFWLLGICWPILPISWMCLGHIFRITWYVWSIN